MASDVDSPLLARVMRLAAELRRSAIDVSIGEVVDACEALVNLDLLDVNVVRCGMRATMVKHAADADRFDRVFDDVFGVGPPSAPGTAPAAPAMGATTPTALRPVTEAWLAGIRSSSPAEMRLLAARAVDLYAGLDASVGGERYFLHRVLRAIDLSRMLAMAMQELRRGGHFDELELLVQRNELAERLEEFRRQLAREIGRRLRGLPEPPKLAAHDLAQRDVVSLSPSEIAELRRLLQPLARRLAARAVRRRPNRNGRLDTRRTIRRSLQTGGVPLEVANRRRHPHRPEIVVLCDVSGSVAQFAQFTFTLVNAVHRELSTVRSFAFVDGIAEVTTLFATSLYEIPVARFVERPGVVRFDGHSDYGATFARFEHEFLSSISARATVLVTGDARNNYRDVGVASFRSVRDRARHVYWLNPEPEDSWDTTDSVMASYRPYCDRVFEVRTLEHLAAAIAEIG